MAFALFALLVLLSALLYPPNNYDGLTYRLPRLLNWLSQGNWHWIDSVDARLNNRACGYEWNVAPWLALTGTDRGISLLNLVSFLLLPGLIFSVFTRLGVRRRVAWCWMWLLPTGYCFLLQAGGSGNDLFSAPLVLAALDFALRARTSGRMAEACLSIAAAGIMTSVKTTNMLLVLPWALAIWPVWRLLLSRPLLTAVITGWAALASVLPTLILNHLHCGDWTGANMEKAVPVPTVVGGITGNAFLLLQQNLTPTIFPWAPWWNARATQILPSWLRQILEKQFEANSWSAVEIPIEESAGLGFGLGLALAGGLIWLGWSRLKFGPVVAPPKSNGLRGLSLLVAAPWVSLLIFTMKVSIITPSRILAPFFPILLPALFRSPRWEQIIRSRPWRVWVGVVLALALFSLAVNPSRPLWPARTVLPYLVQSWTEQPWLQRASAAYTVYAVRGDALALARSHLPAGAHDVGLVTIGDDPETSLWRPFGSRRIHQLGPSKSVAALRASHIEYVVINPVGLSERFKMSLAEWLEQYEAEVVATVGIRHRVSRSSRDWVVARLRAPLDPVRLRETRQPPEAPQ